MKRMYAVAGLLVQAEGDLAESWREFLAEAQRQPDITILRADRPLETQGAPLVSVHEELLVRAAPDGGWLLESPKGHAPVQVYMNRKKTHVLYHMPDFPYKEAQMAKLNHLLRTVFECRFCKEGVLSLHAACVETDGQAIAFTGRSGLGKSTRATAWCAGLGAKLISGDRPAVRIGTAQGADVFGVPWDGKEQIFRSVQRPLRCMLEVRRSPANYVRRLSAVQAREMLTRQSFVPMWDTDAAATAIGGVRKLIRQTPVYRVFCGPGEEDAREIYDVLFRHPEKIKEEAEDMKIRDGFVLRNVVDEYIVMPTGGNIAKFEGAIVLSEVSAFIFRQMADPVSREDVLKNVLEEYDVDEETAARDIDALLAQFDSMGILEK